MGNELSSVKNSRLSVIGVGVGDHGALDTACTHHLKIQTIAHKAADSLTPLSAARNRTFRIETPVEIALLVQAGGDGHQGHHRKTGMYSIPELYKRKLANSH